MAEIQLCILPPGERFAPFTPAPLHEHEYGNARMLRRGDTFYLAMRHGKRFPDDLNACDHDRAAALGYPLGVTTNALPFDAALSCVPVASAETLGRLLLSTFGPDVPVRVCRAYGGPDVLRAYVGSPPVMVTMGEALWAEFAYKLPSLRDLIVKAVRRRQAAQ